MKLDLVLENKQERRQLTFNYSRMINAGYVGKNQEEVRRHIEELAAKGIPGPKSIPVLFPVVCHALTTDSVIEVYGTRPQEKLNMSFVSSAKRKSMSDWAATIRTDT